MIDSLSLYSLNKTKLTSRLEVDQCRKDTNNDTNAHFSAAVHIPLCFYLFSFFSGSSCSGDIFFLLSLLTVIDAENEGKSAEVK